MTLRSCPRRRPLDGRLRLSEEPVELWKSLELVKTWKTTAMGCWHPVGAPFTTVELSEEEVPFPLGCFSMSARAAKFVGRVIAECTSSFWMWLSKFNALSVILTTRLLNAGTEIIDLPGKPVSLLMQVSWATTAKRSPENVSGLVVFCKAELSRSFFSNSSILSKSLGEQKEKTGQNTHLLSLKLFAFFVDSIMYFVTIISTIIKAKWRKKHGKREGKGKKEKRCFTKDRNLLKHSQLRFMMKWTYNWNWQCARDLFQGHPHRPQVSLAVCQFWPHFRNMHFKQSAPTFGIQHTAYLNRVFFFFYLSPDSSHTFKRWIVEYSGGETSTLCRPEVSASTCLCRSTVQNSCDAKSCNLTLLSYSTHCRTEGFFGQATLLLVYCSYAWALIPYACEHAL